MESPRGRMRSFVSEGMMSRGVKGKLALRVRRAKTEKFC
jgi:hypothetical protein